MVSIRFGVPAKFVVVCWYYGKRCKACPLSIQWSPSPRTSLCCEEKDCTFAPWLPIPEATSDHFARLGSSNLIHHVEVAMRVPPLHRFDDADVVDGKPWTASCWNEAIRTKHCHHHHCLQYYDQAKLPQMTVDAAPPHPGNNSAAHPPHPPKSSNCTSISCTGDSLGRPSQ